MLLNYSLLENLGRISMKWLCWNCRAHSRICQGYDAKGGAWWIYKGTLWIMWCLALKWLKRREEENKEIFIMHLFVPHIWPSVDYLSLLSSTSHTLALLLGEFSCFFARVITCIYLLNSFPSVYPFSHNESKTRLK